MDETLSVLAIVIAIAATFSTLYLWRVFNIDRMRRQRLEPPLGHSWLLLMVALACTALDVLATWVGVLAIRRLAGMGNLPWSPPISITLVIIAECLPVYIAFEFWRRRRHSGEEGGPPPFHESD